jgi:acylpyruvate hydrolase
MQGKAWDASTPVGPYLVPPADADIASAGIRTTLNGEKVQESDLSMLIFPVPRLIAEISAFTALAPGDLILTGTPSGVGYRRDPQRFLRDGDQVCVEVDGVGTVRNLIRVETQHQLSADKGVEAR